MGFNPFVSPPSGVSQALLTNYSTTVEVDAAINASAAMINPFAAGTIRILGDSICSQNDSCSKTIAGVSTAYLARYPRWWTMTHWLTGSNINYVSTIDPATEHRMGSNSGVGGALLSEILTTVQTNASSWPEQNIILVGGTNTLNAGASLAEMKTQYTAILDAIIAAGKTPIATTITPRNAVDGANDWSATGTTAAQKRLILVAFNSWLKDYCRENGLRCIDFYSAIVDGDTGDAITGYTGDSVHPYGKGSYYMALAVIREIGDLLPERRRFELHALNDYDATYNPGGNKLNGDLSGTGGDVVAGEATGTMPDNFQIDRTNGTSTAVASIVDAAVEPNLAAYGLKGNAVKLVFTNPGGGSAAREWRFAYWNGSSTSLQSWATDGDLLQASADVLVMSGHGGAFGNVNTMVAQSSALTSGARTTISFDADTQTITDSGSNFSTLKSNRWAIVSGSASNNIPVRVTTAAAGSLTIHSSTPLTTEAAGESVTIQQLPYSAQTGVSSDKYPDVEMLLHQETPILQPYTGNLTFSVRLYLDETIAGEATVYIMNPVLRKLQFTPALLSVDADDTF